jgi:enoyl-CoA hydratase
MSYSFILTEIRGNVGLIRFHRPAVRNALCEDMVKELAGALDAFEADDAIGAIVLTGDERAFAAGADISEMAKLDSFAASYLADFNGRAWIRLAGCRKPTIAAVAGYALGGGCELALMCDFILAADTAKFGQLEVTVGLVPGGGGTQRLARSSGNRRRWKCASPAESWMQSRRIGPDWSVASYPLTNSWMKQSKRRDASRASHVP